MFIASDAGHVVLPTGATGLNLAASAIYFLHCGLVAHVKSGDETCLQDYSRNALAKPGKAERSSWHMTTLLHDFPDEGAFGSRIQNAELDYLFASEAAKTSMAEYYLWLPYE